MIQFRVIISGLIFGLYVISAPLAAQQLVVDENFEDADITQNPEWTGVTGNFTFFDDLGNTLLQLNDSGAGTSQIRTVSTAAFGTWEFFIDQDFAPSDGNRGFVFLISDIEDLSGNVNGYAIRTGESGSDDTFRLFRFTNGTGEEILTGQADLSSGGPFQVRVTRAEDGTWELFESAGYGSQETSFVTTVDNTHTSSGYFGFLLNYTSTRAQNFYFDDIKIVNREEFTASNAHTSGAFLVDVTFNYPIDNTSLNPSDFFINNGVGTPSQVTLKSDFEVRLNFGNPISEADYILTINNVENIYGGVIDANTEVNFSVQNPFEVVGLSSENPGLIELEFSEELEPGSLNPSGFEIFGSEYPDQVSQPEPGKVELEFTPGLQAGEYTLVLSNIESINGWPLTGNLEFDFFIYDPFESGDLFITELFYRPPPEWRPLTSDRPAYIEIYNPTEKILNLRNWTLNGENIRASSDLAIEPEEYLVLTNFESIFRDQFGDRNFAETESFPEFSLTTEDQIVLKTDQGVVVDSLFYRAGLWGGNEVALERFSNSVSAIYRDNWGESEDVLLGSPGLSNTVTIPENFSQIVDVEFPLPQTVHIIFSRALSQESVDDLANFSMGQGVSFTSVRYNHEDRRILEFETDVELDGDVQYPFSYADAEDIFGNRLSEGQVFDVHFLNPFRIASARAENGNQVVVEFTQPLEVSSVVVSDFQLSDGTAPINLEFPNSESVRLDFPDLFTVGEYEVEASGLESLIGWEIEQNTSARFYIYDDYEPGDILISEFMYDEPEGYSKYVELYNRSEKLLNLKDWELRRGEGEPSNGGKISEMDVTLRSGEYLVITSDTSSLIDIFGDRSWLEMVSFPGYTTSQTSTIRLLDSMGQHADSLRYDPSVWGGNEIALERRSFEVDAIFSENWGESPSELLGTPGLENEVETDIQSPVVTGFEILQDQSFKLSFDERLDAETATQIENYSISPFVSISFVILQNNVVTLIPGEALEDRQTYEINVRGITDLFGNVMDEENFSFRYLDFKDAQPQQIVINEILYRRVSSSDPEFVEIFNRTDQNFDLTGWYLGDESGSTQIPDNTTIESGEYMVFTDVESYAAGNPQIIYLAGFPSLNDDGDAVVIKDGNQTAIDSLFYNSNWGENIPGISLERKDPNAPTLDGSNWESNDLDEGSTPAAENSRFAPDETGPEIIFANLFHPDSLEVRFNEFINLDGHSGGVDNAVMILEKGPAISDQDLQSERIANIQFSVNGNSVNVIKYDPDRGNRVVLDGVGLRAGEELTIVVEGVADYQGNVSSIQNLVVAQPVQEDDLVFNEIMFHPLADNRDELPNQTEYIEIYNRRSYAVSLEGLFLHDEPDENGEISAIEPVSTFGRWIPANGYVFIYPETETSDFKNSQTASFFELSDELAPFAIRVDRSSLSLTTTGREVYLADSTRKVIDRVNYSTSWHNPNLTDTRGIALERINPDLETNEPSNWGSNTSILGGTPGSENTLYQPSAGLTEENGVRLTPNPFSPDNDGYDDNLLIQYSLDEPDYLLRIRIYDRYGRLIRKLADARPAGLQGTIIWDGRMDNRQRNRIGIYIVYIEAYNSTNGKSRIFKKTAVLARQF